MLNRLIFALSTVLVALPALAQDTPDVSAHLTAISALASDALAASESAANASSLADVKVAADAVFATVWGMPSGIVETQHGAVASRGWKTRWQTTYHNFGERYAKRYADTPPEINDIAQLGIVGRGRAVRKALVDAGRDDRTDGFLIALNNVIGWMKMDDGRTKGEVQPRVDMTRMWDAPKTFWNSTADTGWLHEVHAQAVNILKTDYDGDLDMAKAHASDLHMLVKKVFDGLDADGDGTVAPVIMEGGLNVAMAQAKAQGLVE
ncbi:MAG: hypothetical protein AAGJ10_00020 [Bacteroidota bacterium]